MATGVPPQWITPAGSLGVVPEGRFYRVDLQAIDPLFPTDPTKVTYYLIAGALPAGVQVNLDGSLQGIPVTGVDFQGVPAPVAQDVTSKFAIRAQSSTGDIADRTFTLTVSGQNPPSFVTPAGTIGTFYDSEYVSFQFTAYDPDPGDVLSFALNAGTLPPGLTLSSTGLLSGYIDITATTNINYNFTLQVTDTKDYDIRSFSMFVYSHVSLTADNTTITADNTFLTADVITTRSPYILDFPTNLGTVRDSNYFAYKFKGVDPDNAQIVYSLETGFYTVDSSTITADNTYVAATQLPMGLELDPQTGWLSGYLIPVGLTSKTYTFGVRVKLATDPSIESPLYTTQITLIGNIDSSVTWLSPTFLGTIDNGAISTFSVEAYYSGSSLSYSLDTGGVYNKLPQGLTLEPSGNIVGKVSFKTFSLDGGTTTFDSNFQTRLQVAPTTFDLTYTFIVRAKSSDGYVSVTKQFTILVDRKYNAPYNILYCKAMPPLSDRTLLNTLLNNTTVLDPQLVYRPDDPFFGTAKEVVYQHAYGMTPVALDTYVTAVSKNHYHKQVVLGQIKVARALDSSNNVIYEAVYAEVIDPLVNAQGESPPLAQTIKYPALDNGVPTTTVYPNSLTNMRAQLVSQVGQISKVLPTWMLSKQADGTVLGFTPAWVIAYALPGKGDLLKYKIEQFFGTQLNLIDFEIDRITLDSRLARNWNTATQTWNAGIQTTFDRKQITADSTLVKADTTNFILDGFVQRNGTPGETIFDGGSCRFVSPVVTADISVSDTYDQYILFPKTEIVNNQQ